MRVKNIIFLLVALFFFIPKNVFAVDTTKKMYIRMNVLEDGSLQVEEIAELSGNYNGRLRTIEYRNPRAREFTGKYEDFSGSSIYNGSGITDLKVCDIASDISKNSFQCEREYREVASGREGMSGVYEKEDTENGVSLKIYNPSSRNRAFYLSYTIPNVVVVHNDVAEIAWNILGYTYEENIKDFKVWVQLPEKDPDLRVWLKGNENNLNGEIRKEGDDTAYIYYDFLGAHNPVTVRMMFDKNIVLASSKKSGVMGREFILKTEKKAADDANRVRDRIKRQNGIVVGLTSVWVILSILATIYLEFAKRKNQKVDFYQDYYRDFPGEYGPEVLEYLLKKNISDTGMSASILNMIEKKVLKISENPKMKKDYYLILADKEMMALTENEKRLCKILIEEIGDKEKVLLSYLRRYGTTQLKAQRMISQYTKWKDTARKEGEAQGFFLGIQKCQILLIILGAFSFLVFYLNIWLDTKFILGYFVIVIGIMEALYAYSYSFKTEKGALEYAKWQAFKRFLKDFGTLDEKELPEVTLWGKYLVYATVLGCAKEVEKAMELHIDAMNLDQNSPTYLDYYYANQLIHAHIYTRVSSSVTSAVASSRSSIASSSSSSSSGFGGGGSFGGGSFGGGGGGGRF